MIAARNLESEATMDTVMDRAEAIERAMMEELDRQILTLK